MRSGKYKDAKKDIKEKWKFVGLTLIPKVNASWNKIDACRKNLMSDVITLSDEVIVQWYFHAFFGEWKKKHKDLAEARKKGEAVAKTPRKKRKGEEHASKKFLFEFS